MLCRLTFFAALFATSSSTNRDWDTRPKPLPPRIKALDASAPSVLAQTCSSTSVPWQTWTYNASSGFVTVSTNTTTLCLTAATYPPTDGLSLVMLPCGDASLQSPLQQSFSFTPSPNAPGNQISLVMASAPSFCANIAGYGTTPGSQIWLYTCSASDCQGNCQWTFNPSTNEISNPTTGLCMDASTGPPSPHTCDEGSPSASLPFCDPSLDMDTRIDDLWNRLSNETRIGLFSIPIQPNPVDEVLNIPSVYWDITCIAGLSPGRFSPQPNVTVFPCTTGQAASFDIQLVKTLGQTTALEGRIVNQINYRLTGGKTWQGLLCDGGPLANTQHDPRWGRVSETYGEDYWLTAAMGIAATQGLQQRTQPDPSSGNIDWLVTSQVTRHFFGTHGASDLANDAEEYILPQWREEHQMRVYEAFQRPDMGDAEGIMCAISAIADAGDVPPPRNNPANGSLPYIPNCVNTYILDEKLRTEWKSDAFIQSDCCDSIDSIVNHKYVDTLEEAVAAAVNAGLSSSYGNPSGITAALVSALNDGLISNATYESRIKRTLRTLFRVGMFDTSNTQNPNRGPYNESLLDGPDHRAIARKAVARSIVLLENKVNASSSSSSSSSSSAAAAAAAVTSPGSSALPFTSLPANIAVIGPFSHCTNLGGGYGGHDHDSDPYTCNYGHSYSGFMSEVSTYLTAAQDEANAAMSANHGTQASTVQWVLGSRVMEADGANGLSNASMVAAAADMVLLCLGTGTQLEVEGLDRTTLLLPQSQLDLVKAVTSAIPATSTLVIVLVTAGTVDFVEPRADALIYAPYSGEETGHGLWDVLMGRAMPSARMPLTTFRTGYLSVIPPLANFNMMSSVAGFSVGRTYRYFNDTNTQLATNTSEPYILYHFGYGLSYCAYSYSNVQAYVQADNSVTMDVTVTTMSRNPALPSSSSGGPGCQEVTEVYVTLPRDETGVVITPIYSLAAFASTPMPDPTQSQANPTTLYFVIPADAFLTTYVNGTRTLAGGAYTLSVSGHLPDDAQGTALMSNVLTTNVMLPWSGGGRRV